MDLQFQKVICDPSMYKKFFIILAFICSSLLLILATTRLGYSDEFPLKDGRYVSDQKFCYFNEDQIFNQLGDAAALSIRTFKNGTVDFHYETKCRIEDVTVLGKDVIFTSVCSAEGEEFSERKNLVLNSSTSFTDGQTTFNLCEGRQSRTIGSQTKVTVEPAITEPEMVFALQSSLKELGFDPGPIDGAAGRKTITALNNFLASKGISSTSVITQTTFDVVARAHIELVTGVKWDDFEEYKPNDERQSIEGIEPAGGEVGTSGENQAPKMNAEEFQSYIKQQTPELQKLAALFREMLVTDRNRFFNLFSESVYPTMRPALKNGAAIDRLLSGSLEFFGCVGDPVEIIAYYNTPQDIWTILWVENRERIVQARLSMGFLVSDRQGLNSWFERMVREQISAQAALQQSIVDQGFAFTTLFNPETCVSSRDINEELFDPSRAAARMYKNEGTILLLDDEIREQIKLRTNEKFVGKESHSVFLTRIEEDKANGQHFILTLHSVRDDPTIFAIQKWQNVDGELSLLDAELVLSFREDEQ